MIAPMLRPTFENYVNVGRFSEAGARASEGRKYDQCPFAAKADVRYGCNRFALCCV